MAEASAISKLREEYSPRIVTVNGVCVDGDASARLEAARSELEEHKGPTPAALKKRVEKLEKEVASKTHTFTFKSIGRHAWTKLKAEHPASDEDKEANPLADLEVESFSVAAVAKCCIEMDGKPIQLSHDDAEWLMSINDQTALALYGACNKANFEAAAGSTPLGVTGKALSGKRQ